MKEKLKGWRTPTSGAKKERMNARIGPQGRPHVNLLPQPWPQGGRSFSRPLIRSPLGPEGRAAPDVPWIAFGWDTPDQLAYFEETKVGEMFGATSEQFQEAALASLASEPVDVSWTEKPISGVASFRLATIMGGYFTCAKILDVELIRRLEHDFQTPSLAIAVPARNVMFAMDARALAGHPHLPMFLDVAGRWYGRALATRIAEDAISRTVLLTAEGKVAGFASLAINVPS
jgi:hypothetical protein